MYKSLAFLVLIFVTFFSSAAASSETQPHGHKGILRPFDGKPLLLSLTKDEEAKLAQGNSVSSVTKSTGKAYVVQDIAAEPSICMNFIKNVAEYHKYVPSVKSVAIYGKEKTMLGVEKAKATFNVAVFGIKFRYFLITTLNPLYNTFTWTLDYSRNSDFDDNVGHWQVMKHPSKVGWTRVLYSCQVRMFSWVPGIVINFLTKTALVEATSWVKKESEKYARDHAPKKGSTWFTGRAEKKIGSDILTSIKRSHDNNIKALQTQATRVHCSLSRFFGGCA